MILDFISVVWPHGIVARSAIEPRGRADGRTTKKFGLAACSLALLFVSALPSVAPGEICPVCRLVSSPHFVSTLAVSILLDRVSPARHDWHIPQQDRAVGQAGARGPEKEGGRKADEYR